MKLLLETLSNNTKKHMVIKAYREQMKDRLDNVVAEYFSDEEISTDEFFADLHESIYDWIHYHQKFLTKGKEYIKHLEASKPNVTNAAKKDWDDFWEDY